MTDEIVWEEPPGNGVGRPNKWAALLAPFRDRPGEWGRVPGVHHCGMGTAVRKGRVSGCEAGEFEATHRHVDRATGKGDMYVRYIGNADLKAAG